MRGAAICLGSPPSCVPVQSGTRPSPGLRATAPCTFLSFLFLWFAVRGCDERARSSLSARCAAALTFFERARLASIRARLHLALSPPRPLSGPLPRPRFSLAGSTSAARTRRWPPRRAPCTSTTRRGASRRPLSLFSRVSLNFQSCCQCCFESIPGRRRPFCQSRARGAAIGRDPGTRARARR